MAQRGSQPSQSQRTALARLRDDPAAFGEVVLGPRVEGVPCYTPQQLKLLEAIRDNDHVACHSAHNQGKTAALADVVLWWLCSRKPAKVITTAPTAPQVNDLLWGEIRLRYQQSRCDLGLPPPHLKPRLYLRADHFAEGRATDEPWNLQGYHSPHLLAVIDEAAGVTREIKDQVESVASSEGAKVIAIGNPTEPSGWFYEACGSENWKTVHLDGYEHPNVVEGREIFPGMISRAWIEKRKLDWGDGSPIYQARVRGLFPDQAEDTLIALSWVLKAMGSQIQPERAQEHAAVGIDVARFGSNETVVAILRGRVFTRLEAWVGQDTMKTAHRAQDLKRQEGVGHQALTCVDADGIGGGVLDKMAGELGHACVPFHGGETPREEKRFVNKRAEAWWEFREALREGHVRIPPDEKLKAQLSAIKYKFDSAGRIRLETKEEMSKRGLQSPDRADAVVMAWYVARPELPGAKKRERKERDRPMRTGGWRDEFHAASGLPTRSQYG